MKDAKDLIPWNVIDLGLRPFADLWSFNNSIHFDGTTWRCVLRCCDYAMPNGRTIRSKNAGPTGQQTKNAMVILDPTSWRPISIFKMHERDGLPRATTPHRGFEDMRIFRTDKGGLQGIAASLHLQRETRSLVEGASPSQPPEQVVLSFDNEYNIVGARPIRGDGWSGPQKNWVPFDDVAEPRFLYSISKGTMFGDCGRLSGEEVTARPSVTARPVRSTASAAPLPEVTAPAIEAEAVPRAEERAQRRSEKSRSHRDLRTKIRGGDVQIIRGRRISLDAMISRPSARPPAQARTSSVASHQQAQHVHGDSVRVMSGRMGLPKYEGLRGGSQLIRVDDDAWLGVGHEMKFDAGKKLYWHVFYLVDARGKMTAASEPIKLARNGIEFAAGMAIDGDRLVVSFGVDDMNSMLGESRLSAVMEILNPIV